MGHADGGHRRRRCRLCDGGLGIHLYGSRFAVESTVSLDVNPSIEIQVNAKEHVLKVEPKNEDGRKVVGEMDFSGSSLDVTVNALIGSMLRNGYLNENANSILVSVDTRDAAKGSALRKSWLVKSTACSAPTPSAEPS